MLCFHIIFEFVSGAVTLLIGCVCMCVPGETLLHGLLYGEKNVDSLLNRIQSAFAFLGNSRGHLPSLAIVICVKNEKNVQNYSSTFKLIAYK